MSMHGKDREGYPSGWSGQCLRATEPEEGGQSCVPSIWFQLRNMCHCVYSSILDPDLQSSASDPCVWTGPHPDRSTHILGSSYILGPAHSTTMASLPG